jgi:hypothetical protein
MDLSKAARITQKRIEGREKPKPSFYMRARLILPITTVLRTILLI